MAGSVWASIVQSIYDLLEADDTLIALVGGALRFRHLVAREDEPFPYLTFKISPRPGDPYPITEAELLIDVWTMGTTAEGAHDIVTRLRDLLEHATITDCTSPACSCRVFLDGEEDLPTDERSIWRVATIWTLRYYAATAV